MLDENNTNDGVESSQNDSVATDRTSRINETVANIQSLNEPTDSAEDVSDETKNILDADDQTAKPDDTAEKTEKAETEEEESSEEKVDEVEKLLEEAEKSDEPLHKKLREGLKMANQTARELAEKLEKYEQNESPKLNEGELLDDLNAFDIETGEPTAKPFAEKLWQQDKESATRAFEALAMQKDERGWTLGHKFLQEQGIDPTRISDVRAFLEGKTGTDTPGIVPPEVPAEYKEAYKALSKLNQEKALEFLEDAKQARQNAKMFRESGDEDEARDYEAEAKDNEKAALETLDLAQKGINEKQALAEREQKEREEFANNVTAKRTENESVAYSEVFQTVAKSETFKNTNLSTDPNIDYDVKSTFLNQLMALEDPDTVMGKGAVEFFKRRNVSIDMKTVKELQDTVESNSEIKAIASLKGHKASAETADSKIKTAQAKMIALANKYFVQYAKAVNNESSDQADKDAKGLLGNAGIPRITGAGAGNAGNGNQTPMTKYQRAEATAKAIRENA